MALIDVYKRKLQDQDYDYIRCVLFPEIVNPQRVPTQFGIPSALFTHRFHVYVSTGLNGNGVIQLAPKDTTFCCLAVSNPAVAYSGNPTNQVIQMQYLQVSDGRYIPANYAQVRLVACSLRVQYIGTLEQESGFWTSSHVYESEFGKMSDEIIENGYYLARGRPTQGTRQVWFPKDDGDLQFFDTNYKINDTEEGSNQILDTDDFNQVTSSPLQIQFYDGILWRTSLDNEKVVLPMQIYGHGSKKLQSTHPDLLCMSWRGMPAGQTWMRVDVDRHFEGIPRTSIRDLVSVQKPMGDSKTLESLRKVQRIEPLFGQTMEDFSATKDVLVSKTPDLVGMQELEYSGSIDLDSTMASTSSNVMQSTTNSNTSKGGWKSTLGSIAKTIAPYALDYAGSQIGVPGLGHIIQAGTKII